MKTPICGDEFFVEDCRSQTREHSFHR